ncbi:MAG: hypothetical protein ACI8PZ_007397 [Myxococcota bacterium]
MSWTERLGLEGSMDAAAAAPLRVGVYASVALGAWLELPGAAESGMFGIGLRLALAAVAVRAAVGAGDRLDGPAAFLIASLCWGLGGMPELGAALVLVVLAALAGWDSTSTAPAQAPVTVARVAGGLLLAAFAVSVLAGGLSSTPTGEGLVAALAAVSEMPPAETGPIIDVGAGLAILLAAIAVAIPPSTASLRALVWASVIAVDLVLPEWRWGAAMVVALTVPPLPGLVQSIQQWERPQLPGWMGSAAALGSASLILAVPIDGAPLAAAVVAATGVARTRHDALQIAGAAAGGASLLLLHLTTPTARDLNAALAEQAWADGRIEDALTAAETALAAGPPDGELHILRADLRVLSHRLDGALTAAGQALEHGDDVTWHARRKWLLAAAGTEDDADPLDYFQAACDAGDADACEHGRPHPASGSAIPADPDDPVARLRAACDGGSAESCTELAQQHLERASTPKHAQRAAQLLTRACDGRHSEGCVALAAMLATGVGIEADPERAADLYSDACTSGSGEACANVAYMYLEGRGVSANLAKSATLASRGCALGHPLGCRIEAQLAEN